MAEKARAPHEVTLLNRQSMTVTGVEKVESFDNSIIILDTSQGVLTVKGNDLHIKQLDLANGSFSVDGFLVSLSYSAGKGRGAHGKPQGLIDRLLR